MVEDRTTELEQLRAEVARLRGELDTRNRRTIRPRLRRIAAAILAAVAGFLAAASVVGVWSARTALDTERWVATVERLPEHPEFNAAVATYLSTEVFDALDVERRLAQVLPDRASVLAGPLTDAVRDYLRETVEEFLATDRFRELWESVNRFAHSRIVAILEGRSETVSVEGSTVTLNLLPIVNDLLLAVERALPTMFGQRLDLPTLSSGEIPPNLHARIETALGASLPNDFGQITMYDRSRLGQLQEAVVLVKRSVALTVVAAVLALALALWISPNRRRTILQLGLWLAIATFTLSRLLRAVRDDLLGQVPEGVYRDGLAAALHEIFTTLRERGDQLLWLGGALAVLAYLAGPGRLPVALRRRAVTWTTAAVSATRSGITSGRARAFAARHLDALRVGGVVVAAIIALVLSSWAGLLLVTALLAAYVVLVTLLARRAEFSEPSSPSDPRQVRSGSATGNTAN